MSMGGPLIYVYEGSSDGTWLATIQRTSFYGAWLLAREFNPYVTFMHNEKAESVGLYTFKWEEDDEVCIAS